MEEHEKEHQTETQRGTVVSCRVSVLDEKDESVERETMKMQIHCTASIQTSCSAALTFSSPLSSVG